MTNCIFYSLFFAMFLNLSFGSLRFSQVNRVFMSIYKGMLEASVITIDNNGEPVVPYYNYEKLNTYVHDYLSKNVAKYTKEYQVDTVLLNKNNSICVDECRRVSIKLKAKINGFYKYEKEQIIYVESSENV